MKSEPVNVPAEEDSLQKAISYEAEIQRLGSLAPEMSLEQLLSSLKKELTTTQRLEELNKILLDLRIRERISYALREGCSPEYYPPHDASICGCTREMWEATREKMEVIHDNQLISQALFEDEERRRKREGLKLMLLEESAGWHLEVKQKLAAMSPEERKAAAAAIRETAAAAERERRARREEMMRSGPRIPPPGQPASAPSAAPKEKRSEVKHRNPFINNQPLSPEEHAARKEAEEERRAAMTPEEREASQAAARKKAGILTPEERKARQVEAAAREKARIEQMPPDFRARYLADQAKAKKMMAEERARLDAKKRRSL
jgi:hypothetical protein